MTDSVEERPGNRVVVVPAGLDAARIATRVLTSFPREGRRLLVWGSVLRARVKSMTPSRSRRDVISYLEFNKWLWSHSHNGELQWLDDFTPDLQAFLQRTAASAVTSDLAFTRMVIPQAQRLPPDFYWLLRMSGVTVTALVDADATRTDASTVNQICTALSCEPVQVKETSSTTAEIHALTEELSDEDIAVAELPSRRGPRPVLHAHATPEDEISAIADLINSHPHDRVGVFLPDSAMVQEYRDGLSAAGIDRNQWYLSTERNPAPENWSTAGATVLTWSSATGSEFDIVVLPGLESVDDDPPFDRLRRAVLSLGPTARHRLVLSYSGDGRPEPLTVLPSELLDDRSGETTTPKPSTLPSSARVIVTPPLPVFTVPESQLPTARAVTDRDVNAALEVLEFDRLEPIDERRRRILTASEEAGLAQLMRGDDLALTDDLTPEYRLSLTSDDQRKQAFDAFVTHNIGLVWRVASKYSTEHLELRDLVQLGVTGLIRAVEKFDATQGNKFSTYATWWVRQAVSRGIADFDRMVRLPVHIHEKVQKVRSARSRLDSSGMPPSTFEIAQACRMTPDDVRKYLRWSAGVLSLDTVLPKADDFSLVDILSDEDDLSGAAHAATDRRRASALARPLLERLRGREREIVELRYGFVDGEPRTLEFVGKKYGVTRERVRQILKKALNRLVASDSEDALTETDRVKSEGKKATRNARSKLEAGLLLSHHPRSQDLGTEILDADILTAAVTPHVLPHPTVLGGQDLLAVGDPREWLATQGFYLCCRGLPPIHANWLGLVGLDNTEGTALARIVVEIDVESMAHWGIALDQISPQAPEPLHGRLLALAEMARERSRQVLQAHGPIT